MEVEAGGSGRLLISRRDVGGQRDGGNIAIEGGRGQTPNRADQRKTILFGHAEVGDHDIEPIPRKEVQCLARPPAIVRSGVAGSTSESW